MHRDINADTIGLLQECSSGVRMGVDSLRQVEDRIQNRQMRSELQACRQKHERLCSRVDALLQSYGQPPTEPPVMAKGMAWMKTNMKMAADFSDATAADVLTDGCNMGVKSLSQYLNRFDSADPEARAITKELIDLEEETAQKLQQYL